MSADKELDLSPEAYILSDSTREEDWCRAVTQGLGDKAEDYWKITSKQLVGILLVVIAKKKYIPYIKEIRTDCAGVGLMGMMRRNQDYMEICRRTTFPINANEGYSSLYGWVGDYIPPSAKYAVSAVAGGMSGMVDLNYRIAKLPEYEVKNCLENDEIDLLLNFDQLTTQRRNKSAFHEFEEGKITFLPTYKYDFGTNDWDTSEKKRSPAWTDRILWRSKDQSDCKQLAYRSHMEITLSDHKPVSSIFELKLHVNIIEEEEGFNDRDDGHNVIIEKESYQIEDNDECDTL
nr:2165_t:CDS:2 [Entrophospora candida]